MCASPSSSEWWSDARPPELARRIRRPRARNDARKTCTPRWCRSGSKKRTSTRSRSPARSSSARCSSSSRSRRRNGKTIRWCQVRVAPDGETAADGGDAVHGIVCGAGNFFPGDKVVVTLPGSGAARPVPDRRAQDLRTRLRRHDRLGARARSRRRARRHPAAGHAGLDPEVGADAISLLGLDDTAVEVNVTPDRGYAFSIRGIAREYSHATGAAFRDPASAPGSRSRATTRPGSA